MLRKYKNILLLAAMSAPTVGLMAQDTAPASLDKEVILLLIYTAIAVAVVCLALVGTLFVLILQRQAKADEAAEETQTQAKRPSFWARLNEKLTAAVPLDREEEVATDHVYDGIRELDNRLPPWWLISFYASIFFAVIYLWYYHASSAAWSSERQYQEEMAQAEEEVQAYLAKSANLVDENSVTFLTDAGSLEAGKRVYQQKNCAQCHLEDGGGSIGPNFTDNYFIHGGSIQEVFTTIKYGVIEKGMISWADQLSPLEMQQVASYIKSMVGTTPAKGKAPEGEEYIEENSPNASPTDTAAVVSMN